MAIPDLFRRPGFWIAIAVLLTAVAYGLVRARGPQVRTVLVSRKDLEQHILASGRVRVSTRVQVSAQSPGLVKAKAGEVLIQMDDAEARSRGSGKRGRRSSKCPDELATLRRRLIQSAAVSKCDCWYAMPPSS